jgi:hypothetical protein
MTSGLTTSWLGKWIPHGLEGWEEYDNLVRSAGEFESSLVSMGWTSPTVLGEWCARAGENWARQRKVDILHQGRLIMRTGVLPSSNVMASMGAPEYENTPGSDALSQTQDWTWDSEDWSSRGDGGVPPTRSSIVSRRKQRSSVTTRGQRTYKCTALVNPLRTVLGSLLQEYTHLPTISVLSSALQFYPDIITSLFTVFRASGSILASTTDETPIRLCNDCSYLAGETALMALGMGHMGLQDLTRVLEEVSSQMDFCGVYWRERYLVCFLFPVWGRDGAER